MKSNSQKGEFVSRSRSFTVSEFQGFTVSGVSGFQSFRVSGFQEFCISETILIIRIRSHPAPAAAREGSKDSGNFIRF
jgi:hypothetical protein